MDGLIYAFNANSTDQQKYAKERIAALAEARKRRTITGHDTDDQLHRTFSGTTIATLTPKIRSTAHSRDNSYGEIEQTKMPTNSLLMPSATHSETAHLSLLSNPYEVRDERRYLREVPYPLPVDLAEIQRQNLKTLLSCQVFDSAVCSPNVKDDVPERVLEVGCGSGYWSAMCHDYFSSLGHKDVEFTGLDVAPLPPDLTKQGVNWNFVQHDIRRVPFPFDDEHFDLVMLKDISLTTPLGFASQKLITECIRILCEGGTLEIWESDHVVRSLGPHPSILSKQHVEQKTAIETATFLITPGTPFNPTHNKYLKRANTWIQAALDKRRLPSAPCATISDTLHQEPDRLEDIGSRRVAIPFGELRWERDRSKHSQFASGKNDSSPSKGKEKEKLADKALTEDQAALRQTALLTVLQMIESFEPLLKEVNGKNSEEWAAWWGSMMDQLLNPSTAGLSGECLEIGAWWATKVSRY